MNSGRDKEAESSRFAEAVPESLEENFKRNLRILAEREVSLSLLCTTLAGYVKAFHIPRSLKSFLIPIFFQEEKQLLDKWDSILNKCSADLMQITIEGLTATLEQVREQINEVQQILMELLPGDDRENTEAELKGRRILYQTCAFQQELEEYRRNVLHYTICSRPVGRSYKATRGPPLATKCTTYPSESEDDTEGEGEEGEAKSPTSSDCQKVQVKSPQQEEREGNESEKPGDERSQGGNDGKAPGGTGI